jgi:hypothetical protein
MAEEWTHLRFVVEINMHGFPGDGGEQRAKEVKLALLEAAKDFDIDAVVKEITE